MTTGRLVFVKGSPAEASRSSRLSKELERLVRQGGNIDAQSFSVHEFDPQSVWSADTAARDVQRFIRAVEESDGIVLSTPVYKATYAGALKSVVDLIPQDALVDKVALAIATGRRAEHLESIRAAFAALFGFFRVGHVVPGFFAPDDTIFADAEKTSFSAASTAELTRAASELSARLVETKARRAKVEGEALGAYG